MGEQLREEKRDDCQINAIRLRDTYEVKSTILGTICILCLKVLENFLETRQQWFCPFRMVRLKLRNDDYMIKARRRKLEEV